MLAKLGFTLAALACWAVPAAAEDWRLVTLDEALPERTGRSAVVFIDYDATQRRSASVSFTMMVVMEVPAVTGTDRIRARLEADCPPGRYSYSSRQFYSRDRLLQDSDSEEEQTAAPDTNAYHIINTACGGIPPGSETVADPATVGLALLRARRVNGGK